MKCRRCRQRAVIDLKSHNTAFCAECFFVFMERQVHRAIKEHRMFSRRDRILVCVSGGKDSLALWDILLRMGYRAEGLYIDLGIEGYSQRAREKVEAFVRGRGLGLRVVALQQEGFTISELAKRNRRAECSVCGIVKRHYFNRVAVEGGYSVVATGHNLDDEAARLLGNLLHWQWDYLGRQSPVLPPVGEILTKKVEPLCRLTERETAAYAILRGIDYQLEECPMSRGATSLKYKEVLNLLEDWMPGTKAVFYQGFLKNFEIFRRGADHFPAEESPGSSRCSRCGQPSLAETCNFCRLTGRG